MKFVDRFLGYFEGRIAPFPERPPQRPPGKLVPFLGHYIGDSWLWLLLMAQVGECGLKLSGGQRQRLSIARMLLKDAPILLLDEATSALDSEVEAVIQENLSALMDGKTVIAIAHRLSTIAAMDRLIVMDSGAVVQEGTHAELSAGEGLYAQLWARLAGGFLDGSDLTIDNAGCA